MLNHDIIREATRLTRSGQLVEATALLQRMLRGEKERGTTAPTTGHPAPAAGIEPPTIEAKANAAETRRPRPAAQPAVDIAKNLHGLGLGGALRRAPPSMADIVPDGARFLEGVYANAAGSRAYRLFIPSGYHGQAIPLVIMLHGCTQSPEDFAAGTRMNFIAEEQTCFVAYPAQRAEANQAKCWNWFRPADQQRGAGEPSLIAGITRQIMCDHSVDPERVYVAGLSAGAAAAAVMGSTYGDLYAAIGIHSGLACGAASDLPSALMAMKQGGGPEAMPSGGPPVPTIVFHGDRDTTVHSKNGARIVRQSLGGFRTKAKVHRGRVPGGHAYTRTIHTDAGGRGILEHWEIHGAGHAWSGGSPAGSYTDPDGPDATREMLRFFLEHSLQQRRN
ncbi:MULTISPECIES: extracellular catalytic domain type 1 short-chain-length polyhydroxyalkanoate depolymerase [Bradyrhizobium]|uniref:PHB depolymerase family esterase n=1 Tax=Bradyrhizobium vignae TaxID=1549949 RepID=A0ABS4A748_9BRAD|nr:PHB depolymerase family esterase [Bradyrhizobium vignae]MBP0116241.1 PHB depolymerase family esterase [Bradyrhizobium vignae]RXG85297.1 PHB depolymerase family esterase [Bradyrhizobium vignae]